MLGGLRVVQADRTITRFQTQKTGALLAYLALNLESPHARESLAELLWPGGDPVAVRNRLNQAVSSLRRQLEPVSVAYGSVLVTDQRSIRLNLDSVVTDVDEFQKLIHRAETNDDKLDCQAVLKRAVGLYGGEFLHGYYADWIGVEQLRFSDLYQNALYDLLDASRETGNLEEAIHAASLILKGDPADEGTHCDLMRLYIDAGRLSAAKRQFEELARILATEEATPSDEARQLLQEATSKRPTSRITAPAPMANPSDVEPIETPGTNLPSQTNRFVGREPDIERLTSTLLEPSSRLVTIVGLGGTGKTRLALKVARDLCETFSNRVYFIPLTDTKDIRQIEEIIAQVVGVRGSENLIRRLQQHASALLLLDSFEQLADQGASIIQAMLEQAPGLKCLVTSRQPLRVDAERVYPLSALPVPKSSDSVEELIRNPSVALFVDRAQAALPDFQLTPRNAEVVRQICQRLEGLPLALELVASWAKTVAPGQMIAMLADRFALLESRRRDISARHRTMRAVIDSSVSMLSTELQSLFFRLSVFQGGWTLESAAQVCQTPQILTSMDVLSEHSLIQCDNAEAEAMRFRMLDTLRDYAAEHVPAAIRAECSNGHAEYYSELAEDAGRQILRSGQAHWIDRLEQEYANLSAAFQWYLDHDLVESAIRLANSMTAFWELRGRSSEGRHWLEWALAMAEPSDSIDPKVRATGLNNLARLIWMRGEFKEASRLHDEALDAWIQIGDPEGIILAQFNIQLEAHRTRDYDRSMSLLQDNLRRAESLGDAYMQARCWLAMGNTLVETHAFGEAREHYEHSLRIAREIDHKHRIAMALNNLGNLATLMDQSDLARHYLLEAVGLFEAIGATANSTDGLLHLAKTERRQKNWPATLGWIERAWKNHPEETYHIQALFLEQAFVAFALDKVILAATFLGFVERQREELGALNADIEISEYDELVQSVQAAIPDSTLQAAWRLGRDLDLPRAASRMLVAEADEVRA